MPDFKVHATDGAYGGYRAETAEEALALAQRDVAETPLPYGMELTGEVEPLTEADAWALDSVLISLSEDGEREFDAPNPVAEVAVS